nr:DUF4143 domain-containing protein [Trueperella pyogenes]
MLFRDADSSFKTRFALDPQLALRGETPILLDEWQAEPGLWDQVRREIDKRQLSGQFILSGSAMPADHVKGHSGLGRYARVRMRPMTATEWCACPGGVSFAKLASGERLHVMSIPSLPVPELLDVIIHGGWPADHSMGTKAARSHVADYVERLSAFDVFELAGSRVRRPLGVRTLLRSLARNVGQAPALSTLVNDVRAQEGTTDRQTVKRWLEALEQLFVLEAVPAWSPRLRSKAVIRTSPVYYLADASLTAYMLGGTVDSLIDDVETAGFLFENFVYHQLATYAEAVGGRICHYRDSNGKEFDAVVILEDGSWIGVETKLGQRRIAQGIAGLVDTRNQIDSHALGEPRALLLVVGGTDIAYTDPETGVQVVPVQALEA